MQYRLAALAGLIALGTPALALAQSAPPAVYVVLPEQNKSGETGIVTLTQAGANVHYSAVLSGGNATGPQPIHIHAGTCAALPPAPKYPFKPVVNGQSDGDITGVKLADLQTGGFAINVHKSVPDAKIYVACGDIPKN